MRKRLRRKLKLDEFGTMGIRATVSLAHPLDDAQVDDFRHDLIRLAKARGLRFRGVYTGASIRYDFERIPSHATDEDMAAAREWFRARGELSDVDVRLQNAYYPGGRRRR